MERSPSRLPFLWPFVWTVRVPLVLIGLLAALPIANYRIGGQVTLSIDILARQYSRRPQSRRFVT